MNYLKLYFIFCVWALCAVFQANAQHTLSGKVVDAETETPIDAVNVVILRGQRTVDFSITNAAGEFQLLSQSAPDSLTLNVSSLGYETYSAKIGNARSFDIRLNPQPIKLKEVTIRPGRVWGRNDTIRFDAAQFLRAHDKSVEDLIKRLPGIDVDDNGKIQYRGKDIGTMYIEGLDLMGTRYKTISKNLSAQSIKGVEVLDNHQRIKSLAGKIPSDVPDINLKLKDDFKDKWTFNGKTAAGFLPEKLLYELEGNSMQIARKSQSLYGAKCSNTGNGITKEADESYDEMLPLPTHRLLSENSVSAPLKEPRWLFDNAALATANRLYRTGEDSRLKLNAFYTRNDIRQQTREKTTYYNPRDTTHIDEERDVHLKKDLLNFSADYENNTPSHFLRNKLDFRMEKETAATDISGTYHVAQQTCNRSLSIKNNTSFTRQLANGNVMRGQSVVGYWQNREQLQFKDHDSAPRFHGFYAQAQSGVVIGKTKISQDYLASASLDFNNLKMVHKLEIKSAYEYLFGNCRLNWALPLTFAYLPEERRMNFLPQLSARLSYKVNYAWNTILYAKYDKKLGEMTSFYREPHFVNYRTRIENQQEVPLSENQVYSARVEYKNTLNEFFFTSDVFFVQNWMNYTMGQQVDNGIFRHTRHTVPHRESSKGFKATISKGFYDLHAKVSLDAAINQNSSAQIRDGNTVPFSFGSISFTPKCSISPSVQTEIAYTGDIHRISSSFGQSGSARLWQMNHQVTFYYTHKNFETNLTCEYFRNQLTEKEHIDLFFMDFTAGYKFEKLSVKLSLNNLLNQKSYQYTLYNPLSVYSSRVSLRPREVLLSLRFRF